MEKKIAKPRVNYADYFVAKNNLVFDEGTVSWVIERYIRYMNGWGDAKAHRELGQSHEYTLRRIQRSPIGKVIAKDLTKADVIAHMKMRQAEGIKPQTANQDYTYLAGALKYAGSEPTWGCDGVSARPLEDAKPYLNTNNLTSKSTPRERRPQPEEIKQIEALAAESNARAGTFIDMVKFARWQIASGRRLSESCRITWRDWDYATHTMLVHKMKDPKNRNKTKRVALTDEAQDMLLEMAWTMNEKPETWSNQERRIHPYNAKSVGAKYTTLKKRAGIPDLHLHDLRAECCTRLVEKGYTPAQAILVSGHETTAIFERTYMRMNPENFRLGPISQRKP